MTRQINEWIFGNLLEGIPLHPELAGSMFAASPAVPPTVQAETDDGLMVSAAPVQVIELPIETYPLHPALAGDDVAAAVPQAL